MGAQVKGENTDVQVKRLPKKPTPPRFGRKLTAAQKDLATHICVDCGWIYCAKYGTPLCPWSPARQGSWHDAMVGSQAADYLDPILRGCLMVMIM